MMRTMPDLAAMEVASPAILNARYRLDATSIGAAISLERSSQR